MSREFVLLLGNIVLKDDRLLLHMLDQLLFLLLLLTTHLLAKVLNRRLVTIRNLLFFPFEFCVHHFEKVYLLLQLLLEFIDLVHTLLFSCFKLIYL